MLGSDEYEKVVDETLSEFPSFRLLPKSQSLLMKVINVLLLIITLGMYRRFMQLYVTTIGLTVYVPENWATWSPYERAMVLRHERIHMRQRRAVGKFWFSLSYLLLPLPGFCALYRRRYEQEAYRETMRALLEYYGQEMLQRNEELIVSQFRTSAYFWMWVWDSSTIQRWWDETVAELLLERVSGSFATNPANLGG